MHLFRAVAAPGLIPALGLALLTSAAAQTTSPTAPWPSGRAKLAWLEGRWTSSICGENFSEYRFTAPNQTGLTFTYGPPAHPAMKVDVYYDVDGNIVLYFPSISFRTIVLFKDHDHRDTIDIDKSGTSTRASYKRCER
jgi:hypothetical protein